MDNLTASLSEVMQTEFGVEVIDVRVKRIELPGDVSSSVFQRMSAEREVLAREHRARGREMAQGIRATRSAGCSDSRREKTARKFGEGDARATATYAEAFNADPEFYEFTRSLNAYRRAFSGKDDVLVLDPSSDFFKYLGANDGKD